MKTGLLLFFFCSFLFFKTLAQKPVYSHQTVHLRYDEQFQLIANISNNNHFLVFRPNQMPSLYVYDQSLKLQLSKKMADVIPQNCDIQMLHFKDYYFLFAHLPNSSKYQFWKVDAFGNAINMMPMFTGLQGYFKDTNASIQVNTDGKHIFLMTQVYYDQIGKLQIEKVTADSMLHFISSKRFVLEYNPEYEGLNQVIPTDENRLLVLKRSKNDNSENILELMKCDMQSGEMEVTQFNIGHNLFAQTSMYFNPSDSSIFISSRVRESFMSSIAQRLVFMCRLNYSLQPIVPATLLKSKSPYSFILVPNLKLNWLHFLDNRIGLIAPRTTKYINPQKLITGEYMPAYDYGVQQMQEQFYLNETNSRNTYRIRFSILDEHFKVVRDSVMEVNNKGFTINVTNFGKIRVDNKNYLVLEQRLPDKSNGLLLIAGSGDKRIEFTDLNVYNHYHYLPSQIQQTGDGNFIMPYLNKKEVGLMKIRLD